MKKILFLLLLAFNLTAQVKQIATFTSSKIPIGVTAVYYFIGDNGDVLRPISTDVLNWDLTNKTPLSDYLKDNLPSSSGIGIGFPNIVGSPNISGFRKLYYYDPIENNVGWHYVKNGVTLPFQFTLLANAKKLIKPNVTTPPATTPVVTVPPVVTPPAVVTPPTTTNTGNTNTGTEIPADKPALLSPLDYNKHLYNENGTKLATPIDINQTHLNNYLLTDDQWDNFKGVGAGVGKLKAWKIDNDDWSTIPLKNIQLPTNMSKRTVIVHVCFISSLNDTVGQEIYQAVIQL